MTQRAKRGATAPPVFLNVDTLPKIIVGENFRLEALPAIAHVLEWENRRWLRKTQATFLDEHRRS